MSFLKAPKLPPPPPVPPPPPLPPAPAVAAEGGEEEKLKEKLRRKRGLSSTILTGGQGLLPEQMPVSTPYLLGSAGSTEGSST